MVDEIGIVNGLIIEYLRSKGAPYVDSSSNIYKKYIHS